MRLEENEIGYVLCDWKGSSIADIAKQLCIAYQSVGEGHRVHLEDARELCKYHNAVIGGTFDHLHQGHKVLLSIGAWISSEKLYVGISGDALLQNKAFSSLMQSFEQRCENVVNFVHSIAPWIETKTECLQDMFGPSLREDVNVLIVSQETESGANVVNSRRIEIGAGSIDVLVVPLLMERVGKTSSTEIRRQKMMEFLRLLWEKSCESISRNVLEKWWSILVKRYGEDVRKYHTLEHLYEMFAALDKECVEIEDINVVRMSIWFHDLVYDPQRSDNEYQSMLQWEQFCDESGLGFKFQVSMFIEATRSHSVNPEDPSEDLNLFLDLDLLVLARPWESYLKYTRQIRQEYSHLSDEQFRNGREKVLESFLSHESIYHSRVFNRLERLARENIKRELQLLN